MEILHTENQPKTISVPRLQPTVRAATTSNPLNATRDAAYQLNQICGHPKSGKTLQILQRALQTARQGHKTLLLSQNPVETSALQEKLWIEKQRTHRANPETFPLTILYSHELLEEIVKKLFPQLGYFKHPIWTYAENTHPLDIPEAFDKNIITIPLAIFLMTRPGHPTGQQLSEANLKYDAVFCDDATLQPGYFHDLLPKLINPGGSLTEVRLRSDPHQLYGLPAEPITHKRPILSIQCGSSAKHPNKAPQDPLIGRWTLSTIKKILLDEYEFAYSAQKSKSLDIALALPLGSKTNRSFNLDHPWSEAKRWQRYLLEHQQRFAISAAAHTQKIQLEIGATGLHPAAGSSILTREVRTQQRNPQVQIFCQPYYNLYGHFYDWLLFPYLNSAFLPKTPHRQMHYLWFLASRASHAVAFCQAKSGLPAWLLDPRHPSRRALEKFVNIQIQN